MQSSGSLAARSKLGCGVRDWRARCSSSHSSARLWSVRVRLPQEQLDVDCSDGTGGCGRGCGCCSSSPSSRNASRH